MDPALALHASRPLPVSSSRRTGISLRGVFGCRTRSIGERSMACSSTSSHVKNCCSPLWLFSTVDADLV